MKKKSLFVCFTIVGALLILFTGAQAESPATAAISAGGIVITPPAIADFEAMNVRIMSPDGVMVLNTQSMGESVAWSPTAGDPDGKYRYEAIVITYDPDADTGEDEGPDGQGLIPLRGSFQVEGGAIAVPIVAPSTLQNQSLWQDFGNAAMQLAQKVMDIVVPSAHAADLTAEDASPEIRFDDTNDEDYTPSYDWIIRAEGGTSDADTGNYFIISGYGETTGIGDVPIIRIDHDGDNSASSPIRALEIDQYGDISLADGTFYFDKSGARIGIGTNLPDYELEISSTSPEIEFYNSSTTYRTSLQYESGRLTFEGDAYQDIFNMDESAPANSLNIDADGNIGFGIFAPEEAVDVYKSGAAARFQLTSVTDTASEAPQFVQRRARSGLSALQYGDNLGLISFRGHTGTLWSGSKAAITAQASQSWSPSGNGTTLLFATTPNNSTTLQTVMKITHDGQVQINGTTLNVPDYVFEDSYKLMPLDDLKNFIEEKKHLPKVASAQEVTSEGLNLGGSQMALLEKVEELTLYTLQQHEQIKGQQAELSNKDDRIKTLEERISSLEKNIEKITAAMGVASE